jgi:hypothetical protein
VSADLSITRNPNNLATVYRATKWVINIERKAQSLQYLFWIVLEYHMLMETMALSAYV